MRGSKGFGSGRVDFLSVFLPELPPPIDWFCSLCPATAIPQELETFIFLDAVEAVDFEEDEDTTLSSWPRVVEFRLDEEEP